MEMRQLLYFKTIVEEGTISKAAKVLHMAQPPLSIQLKHLEEELGIVLLKRHPRKVELTKQGQIFYKRTLQILELCDQSIRETQDVLHQNKLRIGITSSNGGIMLLKNVEQFKNIHPDLLFEIYEGNTYEMIDQIKANIIDLAIVRSPFDSTGLNFYYLSNEPMYVVGSKEYVHDHMTLLDLEKVPLIIYRRYERLILDVFMNHHISPSIICKNDDCRTSLLWANMGYGVALVPQSALSLPLLSSHIKKVPLKEQELYTSVAIIWRNDHESKLIKSFIDVFKVSQ